DDKPTRYITAQAPHHRLRQRGRAHSLTRETNRKKAEALRPPPSCGNSGIAGSVVRHAAVHFGGPALDAAFHIEHLGETAGAELLGHPCAALTHMAQERQP